MKPQWGSVIQSNCPEHKRNKLIRLLTLITNPKGLLCHLQWNLLKMITLQNDQHFNFIMWVPWNQKDPGCEAIIIIIKLLLKLFLTSHFILTSSVILRTLNDKLRPPTWFPIVPTSPFALPEWHKCCLRTCHQKRTHTYM